MQLVTCALSSYGGWGDEFLNKKVVPEYKRRLKEEKEEGGAAGRAAAGSRACTRT